MKELENNWIEKWESVKEKTVCPVDLNTYTGHRTKRIKRYIE